MAKTRKPADMKGDRLDAAKQRAQEKKEEEDLQRALAKTALGDLK
jgi:hypothetical protein